MERWKGRVALVTGASAGIGAALVTELAKQGMTVVGCARNIANIQSIASSLASASGRVVPIQCDLRKEGDILSMFSQIDHDLGQLDVCVNNAGLAYPAMIETGDTEKWREMLEVNVLGLSICTREALKLMKAKNITDGHIIHISSLAGHYTVPGDGNFYACTKHAVKALTEGLRLELRQDNSDIRITCISPGIVDTEFRPRKYEYDEKRIAERTPPYKQLEAKDIADIVVYSLSAPPHVQIHDVLIRPNHQPT